MIVKLDEIIRHYFFLYIHALSYFCHHSKSDYSGKCHNRHTTTSPPPPQVSLFFRSLDYYFWARKISWLQRHSNDVSGLRGHKISLFLTCLGLQWKNFAVFLSFWSIFTHKKKHGISSESSFLNGMAHFVPLHADGFRCLWVISCDIRTLGHVILCLTQAIHQEKT